MLGRQVSSTVPLDCSSIKDSRTVCTDTAYHFEHAVSESTTCVLCRPCPPGLNCRHGSQTLDGGLPSFISSSMRSSVSIWLLGSIRQVGQRGSMSEKRIFEME